MSITLRVARESDTAALLAIYAPYVRETAITFEYDVPSEAEFRRRIATTLARYPYLVAAEGETLLGYAYLSPFIARAAYDWSAETSIYLAKSARGRGLGRRLYTALESVARAQNILKLCACIGMPPAPLPLSATPAQASAPDLATAPDQASAPIYHAATAPDLGTAPIYHAATPKNDPHLTTASAAFHTHLGYRLIGRFPRCGYKFSTWYDMIWMEKQLTAPPATPPALRPFPEIPPAELQRLGVMV